MSIMTQLEFQLDFSNSEKEISTYILDNGDEVLNLSVKQLANKTYSSPATIVRLCKKLGLEGYSDFKIKLSAELQSDQRKTNRIDVNYPFNSTDTNQQIAYKLASLNQECIEDTINLIDFKELDKIVKAIEEAKRILIFGNGNSILAGMDFQHKMLRIGKIIEISSIIGEQPFLAYSANKDDVAIIISYSGETDSVIHQAQILKSIGVPIIGITAVGENQLSKLSTYIINTVSREKIYNKIAPFASKTSIQYILDIFYSIIFKQHYDEYVNFKLSKDKKYDHRHPYNSPINENE